MHAIVFVATVAAAWVALLAAVVCLYRYLSRKSAMPEAPRAWRGARNGAVVCFVLALLLGAGGGWMYSYEPWWPAPQPPTASTPSSPPPGASALRTPKPAAPATTPSRALARAPAAAAKPPAPPAPAPPPPAPRPAAPAPSSPPPTQTSPAAAPPPPPAPAPQATRPPTPPPPPAPAQPQPKPATPPPRPGPVPEAKTAHAPPTKPKASAQPPAKESAPAKGPAPAHQQKPATPKPAAKKAPPAHPQPAKAPAKAPSKPASTNKPSRPSLISTATGGWSVCVASFRAKAPALAMAKKLLAKGWKVEVRKVALGDKGVWYRVCVGVHPSAAKAREAMKRWKATHPGTSPFVIKRK